LFFEFKKQQNKTILHNKTKQILFINDYNIPKVSQSERKAKSYEKQKGKSAQICLKFVTRVCF